MLQVSFAQVESVNYSLKYNNESCQFDCYMVVNQGSAKNTIDRAQFNAQITVVVPSTSNVFVTESYMPLVDNQNRDGEEAASWSISNEVENPAQLSGDRLVSIVPELLPAAFYHELHVGDEVKLFSFKVTPITDCAKDVRLFDNSNDPNSFGNGMLGSDFRNGFTIGGIDQKYSENNATVLPTSPVISEVNVDLKNSINLEIKASQPNASACQTSLKYDIYGPNGLIGDYRTFVGMNKKDLERGQYRVVATDELGCTAEAGFNPYNSSNTVEVELPTEVVSEFSSDVYPNPSQNKFSLTLNGAKGSTVIANILDISGKLVKGSIVNTTLSGSEEVISVNTELSPGMYTLSLNINEERTVNHKLLIIK